MRPLPGGEPPSLQPGEAYQRCLQALGPPHPDYERALVYAVLSLDETLRGAVAQLRSLDEQIRLASLVITSMCVPACPVLQLTSC